MKRLMIVTNSLSGGGAERSMNLVCNELTYRGWSISLVPINAGPEDHVIPSCEVFPLERPWQGGLIDTAISLWKFNRVVRTWKPDAIVLNCDLPELFGATVHGKRNLLVVEHASNPWFQRKTFGKIIRRILTLRKATWVSVSNHLTIWPNNSIPMAVLQNAIGKEPSAKSRTVGEDIRRLLYIGRLSREKRPELALETARLSNHQLIVIGEGILRGELEEQATQESIDVVFRGRLENPWAEIQSGDLLIVPSAFEGDGLVVIEAMQRQVPMLIADIPDLRRFEFPENNYCRDAEDFAKKIHYFIGNLPGLLIPNVISEAILSSRSLYTVGDSWVKFMDTI